MDQHGIKGVSLEVGKHFNGSYILMWVLQFKTLKIPT